MMERFNEKQLLSDLAPLSQRDCSFLAIASAARQKSSFCWYHEVTGSGRPEFFSECIESLWGATEEDRAPPDWEELFEQSMKMMPADDRPWAIVDALAEDALASLCYSIRAKIAPSVQEVAWALRRAYEAADQVAIYLLRRDSREPSEEEILMHPVVQRELSRQRRDRSLALKSEFLEIISASSKEELIQRNERPVIAAVNAT
ncbi:hypothetical protein GGE45_002733 [Rhizobium aethiopicum]|uniref:DUF416 family protein n=1 Tax=Rhizobium aethiopicum TaxID=1138170 RepID=A0A7W6Q7V2_9HYPH|nr:DUF416 family protein [Rhizobium aethiopicum]MBB4189887.1 hypothetical protein [Rhizobium aethiopicum]MBB4580403.1 hypothetical protein [Rhizobium aethiopicum]